MSTASSSTAPATSSVPFQLSLSLWWQISELAEIRADRAVACKAGERPFDVLRSLHVVEELRSRGADPSACDVLHEMATAGLRLTYEHLRAAFAAVGGPAPERRLRRPVRT